MMPTDFLQSRVSRRCNSFACAVLFGMSFNALSSASIMAQENSPAQPAATDVNDDPRIAFLWRYARVERGLLQRVCALEDVQIEKLAHIDPTWIRRQLDDELKRSTAKRMAEHTLHSAPQSPQQKPAEGLSDEQLVLAICRQIDTRLLATLEGSQQKIFLEERLARRRFRDASLAGALIAALDRHLFLSAQQRNELRKPLTEWVAGKNLYWQFYYKNPSFTPDIPIELLDKHLTQLQLESLRGVARQDIVMPSYQMQLMLGQREDMVIAP